MLLMECCIQAGAVLITRQPKLPSAANRCAMLFLLWLH